MIFLSELQSQIQTMHKGHNQKAPLLNNQDQLYYFEMEEINPKRIKYQSGRQSSHHKYQKLPGNEADKRAQLKKSPSGELTVSKPFNPKIITMNGITFKLIEKNNNEVPNRKCNLPTMLVSCYYCHQVQSVPVTTDTFQCGTCRAANECQSLFDMLKCQKCHAKVLYVRGPSQFIKCTRCQQINGIGHQFRQQDFQQQPFYHVFHNDPLNQHQENPYAGTLQDYQKQFELEELISAGENEDLATHMGNMDL